MRGERRDHARLVVLDRRTHRVAHRRFDELGVRGARRHRAQYTGAKHHQLFDRCGTTKVKGISWDHGKAPDQLHSSELLVRLTLDIYKAAAWQQHGDDTCGKDGKRRGPLTTIRRRRPTTRVTAGDAGMVRYPAWLA